jgi:FMN-binding domain
MLMRVWMALLWAAMVSHGQALQAVTHAPSPLEIKAESELKAFAPSLEWRRFHYVLEGAEKNRWEVAAGQSFFRKEVTVWIAKPQTPPNPSNPNGTDKSLQAGACAVLDNAIGKTQPITFLGVYDTAGILVHSSVLAYREAYGGAVGSRAWNSKLRGLKPDHPWKVGGEVDAIAGASLSVQALAKAYRKAAWVSHAALREALSGLLAGK